MVPFRTPARFPFLLDAIAHEQPEQRASDEDLRLPDAVQGGDAVGFSANEIVFDEADFLSEAAHAALKPSAGGRSAEGTVQVFYAASPVDQVRHPDGLVLTRLGITHNHPICRD